MATTVPHCGHELEALLVSERLLERDLDGIVRLPMLVQGRLILPSDLPASAARRALNGSDYAEVDDIQVIRSPSHDSLLLVPRIANVDSLTVDDTVAMAQALYDLPLDVGLQLVDQVRALLNPSGPLLERVSALTRGDSAMSATFLEAWLSSSGGLDGASLRHQIDVELAHGSQRGSSLLEGWMPASSAPVPGPTSNLVETTDGRSVAGGKVMRSIRALPTRQLHVTAGNAPSVPLISCFRALALKSPIILKAPAGALIMSSALALALAAAGKGHPMAPYLSVVYWRGGDGRVEDQLFTSSCIDRIVVWGEPSSIAAVRAKAPLTKTLVFNPRYGISLVGHGALGSRMPETARAAARDAMIWNQKACNATLVVYVEGDASDAIQFTDELAGQLALWDERLPHQSSSTEIARVRRARRSVLSLGDWRVNGDPRAPKSAAVYMPQPFDLREHPMTRVIVVRDIKSAEDILQYVHQSTSQISVAPEALRLELRDHLLARGTSAVVPLGEADWAFAGMPHDSMLPLSELVAWVVS